MLQDQWRETNSPGEINGLPSMTEPARLYSINEYLANPALILRTRTPYFASEDPSALKGDQDVDDDWSTEVPRDPDLYTNLPKEPKRSKPTPQAKPPQGGTPEEAPQAKSSAPEAAAGDDAGNGDK